MALSPQLSRRRFVQLSGLAAGLTVARPTCLPAEPAAVQSAANRDPEAVLAQLIEGNKRFAMGQPTHPGRRPEDFAPLAEGQTPLAVIVGCADSRVAPEVIFDLGIGDLFVVRVAGNVISGAGASVKGSIEYAVAELGVRLIMVLGHTGCGAVKAPSSTSTRATSCPAPSATSWTPSSRPWLQRRISPATSSAMSSGPTSSAVSCGSIAWSRSWLIR